MANQASARVELTDFFSDFTTSDVTINSDLDFQGKAVFELLYSGELVESHEVPVNVKAGESLTKVIVWQKNHSMIFIQLLSAYMKGTDSFQ